MTYMKSLIVGIIGFLLMLGFWMALQDHLLLNEIRQTRQQQLLDAAAQVQQFKAAQAKTATPSTSP